MADILHGSARTNPNPQIPQWRPLSVKLAARCNPFFTTRRHVSGGLRIMPNVKKPSPISQPPAAAFCGMLAASLPPHFVQGAR